MSRHSPAVMPADFPSVAINMSQTEASAHFGLSVWQVIRMMREMSPEWRAEYKRGWAVRSRAAALANLAAAKAKGFTPTGGRKYSPRPMPDGFYEFMLRNSADAGCKEWKTSEATIKRWKAELTQAQRDLIANNAKVRKTAHIKAMVAVRQAANPPKPAKVKTPGKASGRNWGFNKATDIAPARGGLAEDAAQFLRRRNSVVCRGETISGALKGYWIVGARPAMTPDAMIALARAGGFNPDAWRQLAA